MEIVDKMLEQMLQLGIVCKKNEEMRRHTTFKIGGPALLYAEPKNLQQLKITIDAGKANKLPVFIIGQGSNVLFGDDGYYGIVAKLCGDFDKISVEGCKITAGAGASVENVCNAALENSLTGMEFAFGIPGSVGGSIYMDAGAYGGDMSQVVKSVTYIDENSNIVTDVVANLHMSYRHSIFQKNQWCILSAEFSLKKGDAEEIKAKMDNYMHQRSSKQPLELPSAGSAFKRPPGAFAGALIDQCGLRGFRIGDAAISEKHCGFIVNLGNASCADVLAVADKTAEIVKDKTGFVLEKEIHVVKEKV